MLKAPLQSQFITKCNFCTISLENCPAIILIGNPCVVRLSQSYLNKILIWKTYNSLTNYLYFTLTFILPLYFVETYILHLYFFVTYILQLCLLETFMLTQYLYLPYLFSLLIHSITQSIRFILLSQLHIQIYSNEEILYTTKHPFGIQIIWPLRFVCWVPQFPGVWEQSEPPKGPVSNI